MPEQRPSSPTTGKLSTVTRQALLVEVPKWSLNVVRGIGGVIAAVGAWIPIQAHILTKHVQEESLTEVGIELLLPAGFVGFGIMLLLFPKATAVWMFETFNKALGKLLSWIPSKQH